MLTNHRKQVIWAVCLFFLIIFSANQIYILGGKLASLMPMSKTAMVLDVADLASSSTPMVVEKIIVKKIKLAFVGDIMLDRGVKQSVYKNFNGDYSLLFSKVSGLLAGYDILSGNLEGPVSSEGSDIGGIYSFRMEPKVLPVLSGVGFKVLTVANNHIFNWGRIAFTDTLQLLTDSAIVYPGGGLNGAEAYEGKAINIRGVNIAMLSFNESKAGVITPDSENYGIAVISEEEIVKNVSLAKQNNDLVIVSYHFGEEYQDEPNNYQKKYAELAIDSGADLVVGNHPHVIQSLERYKNSYIIYSLGNFIFDQDFSLKTMVGGLLEVEINPESKQIEGATLKKVQLNSFFQIESIE